MLNGALSPWADVFYSEVHRECIVRWRAELQRLEQFHKHKVMARCLPGAFGWKGNPTAQAAKEMSFYVAQL